MNVRTLRVAVAAALALAAQAATAQVTQFNLERLTLDPSARGSLVLGSGETLPAEGFRLSLGLHYENSPLVRTRDGDLRGAGLFEDRRDTGSVIYGRTTLHALVAFGLTDRVEVGLQVPIVIDQYGDNLTAFGFNQPQASGVASPTLGLRLGLLKQDGAKGVSAAIALDAQTGWGKLNTYNGDEGYQLRPRIELGKRFDGFLVAANVGGIARKTAVKLTNGEKLDNELTAGLVWATTGTPVRAELSARGAFNTNGVSQSLELLGGLRWAATDRFELWGLAGPGFLEAPGTPTFRAVVGLALHTPDVKPAPPPPPPPPDPCSAGQKHTPSQCPALDDDGDGIPNAQDKCPLEKGIPETGGCPPVDSDGDGVPDHLDKCPDVKGLAEFQGCLPPDRDGDGVPDAEDKCPDQPGLKELQGCPPARAEIKAGKIDIKEKVFFDTGKATIQARSNALLDDVAKLLVANPQVGNVDVEGHTDSLGSTELNTKLSQARAEAVKAYLVGKGVDAARLTATGFGPTRPAADNKTAAGREQNRRVEFTITGIPK